MSGRTKRILYTVLDWALWLAALGGAAAMFATVPPSFGVAEYLAGGFALVAAVVLQIPALVHELGHVIFGLSAGMKLVSVRFSPFGGSTAGATEMFPKNGKHIRAKALCFTLGGGLFDLLFGGALLALFLCLPYHAALLFCGMCALFFLAEGIRAFLPAELAAGKTDGAVAYGILAGKSEEDILLRVMEAQGILYRGTFAEIPRGLLFDTPTVREDLPAFHALLLLRVQFELFNGRAEEARGVLKRLSSLSEELSAEAEEERARYEGFFAGEFMPSEKNPFRGIRELEEALFSQKNSARAWTE